MFDVGDENDPSEIYKRKKIIINDNAFTVQIKAFAEDNLSLAQSIHEIIKSSCKIRKESVKICSKLFKLQRFSVASKLVSPKGYLP